MNSLSSHPTSLQSQPLSVIASSQNQSSVSQSIGAVTDQFKALSISSQQQQSQTSTASSQVTSSSSAVNQTANNKENSKKTNDSSLIGSNGQVGSKVVLKPREFGREITNATGSTITGPGANPHSTKQSASSMVESSQHQQFPVGSSQQISGIPQKKDSSSSVTTSKAVSVI